MMITWRRFSIELVSGRMYSNENALDSNTVVINESMVRELGLKEPLNAIIENWRDWKVIGVMKDFHFDNLKENVRPLVLARADYGDMVALKLQSNDIRQSLIKIENIWDRFNPNLSIRTEFLDGRFEQMYEDVSRMKSVFSHFCSLCGDCCMFGFIWSVSLHRFTSHQRNDHSKSARGQYANHSYFIDEGLFKAGFDFSDYFNSVCLVFFGSVAYRFCI